MKTDLFQSCGHSWVFQIRWHIECSTLATSSFRTWNSSIGILSLPFIVILPMAHLTSDCRMSVSSWVITPSWLYWSLRCFFYISSVYSSPFFLMFSTSVRSILYMSFIVPIFVWKVALVYQFSWRDHQSSPFYWIPSHFGLHIAMSTRPCVSTIL